MTITFNFLSVKLLIYVLLIFSLSIYLAIFLDYILVSSFYLTLHVSFNVLNETANSPNLEEVALRRRLTLLFNPSLALCFANLYDCPSSLFCF